VTARILVADDDLVTRTRIMGLLRGRSHDLVEAADGTAAQRALDADPSIRVALLDWEMPGMDGDELARWIRARGGPYVYVLLLTARSGATHVVEGLDAGADDYVTKPFAAAELLARLDVGLRLVELETVLSRRVEELETAQHEVRTLQGLLPICMHCKKIRNNNDTWERLETYLEERSDVAFSHGLCQECLDAHYPEPDDEDLDLDRAAGEE
jgi:DNA-binding response OmpR family regulator